MVRFPWPPASAQATIPDGLTMARDGETGCDLAWPPGCAEVSGPEPAGSAAASAAATGIPVRLHFPDGACTEGMATAIGPRGLFVETSREPDGGGCVDVRFTALCDAGPRSIRLPSVMLYRTRDGMALMFRQLDSQAQEAVHRLVTIQAGGAQDQPQSG
jgi:hypothetical protein